MADPGVEIDVIHAERGDLAQTATGVDEEPDTTSSSRSVHFQNCCKAQYSADTVAGLTSAYRRVKYGSRSRRRTSSGSVSGRNPASSVTAPE
jgi:hypothetical protein